MDMSLNKLQELVMVRKAWRAALCGVAKSNDWATELNWTDGQEIEEKGKIYTINQKQLRKWQ